MVGSVLIIDNSYHQSKDESLSFFFRSAQDKKSVWDFKSSQVDIFRRMYRLATAGPWYQLRGLLSVGSEYICPQCNSSFIATRGSDMPAAMGLSVHLSRGHGPFRPSLTSHWQRKQGSGTPWQIVSNHSMYYYCKMPNDTTTAVHILTAMYCHIHI